MPCHSHRINLCLFKLFFKKRVFARGFSGGHGKKLCDILQISAKDTRPQRAARYYHNQLTFRYGWPDWQGAGTDDNFSLPPAKSSRSKLVPRGGGAEYEAPAKTYCRTLRDAGKTDFHAAGRFSGKTLRWPFSAAVRFGRRIRRQSVEQIFHG